MPPMLSIGRIATPMTMMPMPPSHCRIARHNRIPGGAASRPAITVEPVVVMPDIASNTASAALSCSSQKRERQRREHRASADQRAWSAGTPGGR